MKFAFIAPVQGLRYIPPVDYHMVLPDPLLAHEVYSEYYRDCVRQKHTVILDNGAFERLGVPMSNEEMWDLMHRTRLFPTHVVAPDIPQGGRKSNLEFLDDAIRFFKNKLTPDGRSIQIMAVIHGDEDSPTSFVQAYSDILSRGITTVGISYLNAQKVFSKRVGTTNPAICRLAAVQTLARIRQAVRQNDVWHHLLGLGDGPDELILQKQIGLADACDSSSPIWHGMFGIKYQPVGLGLPNGKMDHPVAFGMNFDHDYQPFVQAVQHNVRHILNIVSEVEYA